MKGQTTSTLSLSESESQASPLTGSATVPAVLFGLTIIVSAFLLFQVQPLIAKLILPWFGGSAAVWTSCMLFFQLALLGGYAYAHWLSGLSGRKQAAIHCALLALSLAVLPIVPSAWWKPQGAEDPLLRILGLLTATVGLPYFLLSATSPLLQSWYSRSNGGAIPWRFFALSNAGSMAGLLAYPIFIEPELTNREQAWSWSLAYTAFALLCAIVAFKVRRRAVHAERVAEAPGPAPSLSERILWMALAACASALLLAVTNHLTQNIAAIPFLWVLPLSLYLLSFILCFDSDRWYNRWLFIRLGAVALPGVAYAISNGGMIADANVNLGPFSISGLMIAIAFYSAMLFILFMVCHGELARRKPAPAYLTSFYLMVALGGALGGVLIGFVAPYVFKALYDLPVVLTLTAGVLVWLIWRETSRISWPVALSSGLALAIAVFLGHDVYANIGHSRLRTRNFYGALLVFDSHGSNQMGPYRTLRHGTIDHGEQFLWPQNQRYPTTYYARHSGVGRAISVLQTQGPMNVGVIGLGAGTLMTYGRPVDHYTVYDINPEVPKIATTQFTFLRDCMAPHEVVLGDARLSLEREQPRHFDLLAVDAFSGDAIPVHLLTRQAFRLYWRHLKPDGVLAVHVSNKYLDLAPVVALAAAEDGKRAMNIEYDGDDDKEESASDWVLVSSRPGFFDQAEISKTDERIQPIKGLREWTDDYSNLYRILK
jgi:SAM-dependent methyltransferase